MVLYYVVPNMQLIQQDKSMSCWYASAMMVIEWRRRVKQMTELAHPDPSQVATWRILYGDNTGITNDRIRRFAADLGLVAVPPLSPHPNTLQSWLMQYGPLWVNGKSHITVIAGIREGNGKHEVLVYDPALSKRMGEWRPLYEWYAIDGHSGRDTGADVTAVFLHAP